MKKYGNASLSSHVLVRPAISTRVLRALIQYISLLLISYSTFPLLHTHALSLSLSFSLNKQTIFYYYYSFSFSSKFSTTNFFSRSQSLRLSLTRSLVLHPPISLSFSFSHLLLVVCNVRRKPIQAFVQAFARSRARRLNEPVSLSQRV